MPEITIAIDVIGKPASGKTTVIRQVAEHLKKLGFEVEVNWGIDKEPKFAVDPRLSLEAKTKNIIKKSKIIITERQAPRRRKP